MVFHHVEEQVTTNSLSTLAIAFSRCDVRFASQLLKALVFTHEFLIQAFPRTHKYSYEIRLVSRGFQTGEDIQLLLCALIAMGASFDEVGEFQEALDCYLPAEALLSPTTDLGIVASIMLGLARTYYFLGKYFIFVDPIGEPTRPLPLIQR